MDIEKFEFGALYVKEVRRAHYQAGAPLQEVKGFLASEFYIDTATPAGQRLARVLTIFIRRLLADEAREQEEARQEKLAQEAAEKKRRLKRLNVWRRLTFRAPLRD